MTSPQRETSLLQGVVTAGRITTQGRIEHALSLRMLAPYRREADGRRQFFLFGITSGLPVNPTAIGGDVRRVFRNFANMKTWKWCILPETKGQRLGFP